MWRREVSGDVCLGSLEWSVSLWTRNENTSSFLFEDLFVPETLLSSIVGHFLSLIQEQYPGFAWTGSRPT